MALSYEILFICIMSLFDCCFIYYMQINANNVINLFIKPSFNGLIIV